MGHVTKFPSSLRGDINKTQPASTSALSHHHQQENISKQKLSLFASCLHYYAKLGLLRTVPELGKKAATWVTSNTLLLFPADVALTAYSFAIAGKFPGWLFYSLIPSVTKHNLAKDYNAKDIAQLLYAYGKGAGKLGGLFSTSGKKNMLSTPQGCTRGGEELESWFPLVGMPVLDVDHLAEAKSVSALGGAEVDLETEGDHLHRDLFLDDSSSSTVSTSPVDQAARSWLAAKLNNASSGNIKPTTSTTTTSASNSLARQMPRSSLFAAQSLSKQGGLTGRDSSGTTTTTSGKAESHLFNHRALPRVLQNSRPFALLAQKCKGGQLNARIKAEIKKIQWIAKHQPERLSQHRISRAAKLVSANTTANRSVARMNILKLQKRQTMMRRSGVVGAGTGMLTNTTTIARNSGLRIPMDPRALKRREGNLRTHLEMVAQLSAQVERLLKQDLVSCANVTANGEYFYGRSDDVLEGESSRPSHDHRVLKPETLLSLLSTFIEDLKMRRQFLLVQLFRRLITYGSSCSVSTSPTSSRNRADCTIPPPLISWRSRITALKLYAMSGVQEEPVRKFLCPPAKIVQNPSILKVNDLKKLCLIGCLNEKILSLETKLVLRKRIMEFVDKKLVHDRDYRILVASGNKKDASTEADATHIISALDVFFFTSPRVFAGANAEDFSVLTGTDRQKLFKAFVNRHCGGPEDFSVYELQRSAANRNGNRAKMSPKFIFGERRAVISRPIPPLQLLFLIRAFTMLASSDGIATTSFCGETNTINYHYCSNTPDAKRLTEKISEILPQCATGELLQILKTVHALLVEREREGEQLDVENVNGAASARRSSLRDGGDNSSQEAVGDEDDENDLVGTSVTSSSELLQSAENNEDEARSTEKCSEDEEQHEVEVDEESSFEDEEDHSLDDEEIMDEHQPFFKKINLHNHPKSIQRLVHRLGSLFKIRLQDKEQARTFADAYRDAGMKQRTQQFLLPHVFEIQRILTELSIWEERLRPVEQDRLLSALATITSTNRTPAACVSTVGTAAALQHHKKIKKPKRIKIQPTERQVDKEFEKGKFKLHKLGEDDHAFLSMKKQRQWVKVKSRLMERNLARARQYDATYYGRDSKNKGNRPRITYGSMDPNLDPVRSEWKKRWKDEFERQGGTEAERLKRSAMESAMEMMRSC
ncbi:unnamed protein product [Amoebophrya sp. A120]|nr:unnamed protein product [Amoebophrya sp. A120]|eukprot:GSA120T00022380001.1